MNGISLFCSAGIGELLLPKKIHIVCANELIQKRAECYSFWNPTTKMICGDICDENIKKDIVEIAKKENAKFFLATPPCQGVSTLGKNKLPKEYLEDPRNFLVLQALEIFEKCDFDYGLIENVPRFLDMLFPYQGKMVPLVTILNKKFGSTYVVDARVLNAEDYGVAQSRPRALIKIYKKGLNWPWPKTMPIITLRQAIGNLPSLEAGEDSGIKWHYAKKENPRAVLAMKHTATGKSAIYNEVYYPKKEDGSRIKGFHNTYRRMLWDEPCPARTMYNGSISSHNNVHPGRLCADGTYSDARVLTLLETFIVSSIPTTIEFPSWANENFIRQIIGEAIPPLLLCKVVELIGRRPENANNG